MSRSFLTIFLSIHFFLFSCAPQPVLYQKGVSIAVWDIDDLSPTASAQPHIGDLLSGQVIETLQKRGDYDIVERERLLLALEELHLGTTLLVDESTRLKLGKLVGARFMVFGGYQIIGNNMRLDLRLVEVETGKVLKAVQKTTSAADLSGWIDTARKAAEDLL
jgi:curli biogenesis system outer membrane secretion channel CsgG